MTYADLLDALKELTPEQLAMDLTIAFDGEFYPADVAMTDDVDDILDANHPYIKVLDEA